ncbi:MAG: AAA family ATPase [Verrucomicrobiales bacterium]|nr:AAA family ATPase [Verrucomicrobiales bacterium]
MSKKLHVNKPLTVNVPHCIIIAGPNGAGKTTFAREFLPREGGTLNFVNADLLAAGLSPLKPELAALSAGKLFLGELDRLAAQGMNFAFETTLSGQLYAPRLSAWKRRGYRVQIVFLKLDSAALALRRITDRVRQGGHHVPDADVQRRFARGWANFEKIYKPLADAWAVYDNSEHQLKLLEQSHEA